MLFSRCIRALAATTICGTIMMAAVLTPAAAAGPVTLSIPPGSPAGVAAYLRQETSPDLFRVLYQYGENVAAPNGAYGGNVSAPRTAWYLEYQRAGGVDVIAGVLRNSPSVVDEGMRMYRFAFSRENRAGRFPGSAWPFHDVAMFLAEAAPSLLVLRASSLASRYSREVGADARLMDRAARAMVRGVGGVGRIDDRSKNHRWFEAALALSAVGFLAHDGVLQRWSDVYARHGIAMGRADGVMPENGGHDSGYQALGLSYAVRLLALDTGRKVYAALYRAIARGEAWEASRVRPTGDVNQRGDTRTEGCQERDLAGRCKTTFYAPIFNALTRWAIVTHDVRLERLALQVWLVNWASQPGDVLPPPGLRASPDRVAPGAWLTVSGTRFRPLERVSVFVGGRLMQRMQCDQIGSFGGHSPEPNAHFPIVSLSPGRYVVEARGSLGTVRRTWITVTG